MVPSIFGKDGSAGPYIISSNKIYPLDRAAGYKGYLIMDPPVKDFRAAGGIKIPLHNGSGNTFPSKFGRFYHNITAAGIIQSGMIMIVICGHAPDLFPFSK